jgi:hypothetical protein
MCDQNCDGLLDGQLMSRALISGTRNEFIPPNLGDKERRSLLRMDDEKNDGNEIPVFRSSYLWSFCHLVSNKPQLVCDGGNSGGYSQVEDMSSMAFFDMVAARSNRGLIQGSKRSRSTRIVVTLQEISVWCDTEFVCVFVYVCAFVCMYGCILVSHHTSPQQVMRT